MSCQDFRRVQFSNLGLPLHCRTRFFGGTKKRRTFQEALPRDAVPVSAASPDGIQPAPGTEEEGEDAAAAAAAAADPDYDPLSAHRRGNVSAGVV